MCFCLTRLEEVTDICLRSFVELISALHVSCGGREQPDGFWEFPFGRASRCRRVLAPGAWTQGDVVLSATPQPSASPNISFLEPDVTSTRRPAATC